MAEARRRKLAAQVAILDDEVAELRRAVLLPEDAECRYALFAGEAVTAVCAMAQRVVPLVVNRPERGAFDELQRAVHETLTALADAGDSKTRPRERDGAPEVALAGLTEAELTE